MPDYLISTGLPDYPAGLADKDANLVVPLYQAVNSLAKSVSVNTGQTQYTSGEMASIDQFTALTAQRSQKIFVKAGEALSYGTVVNLSIVSGKIVAFKADATVLTKFAHAVIDVPTGIPLDGYGEAIFLQGKCNGIGSTVFGAAYYLSTAGQVQLTPPVATGVLNQVIGIGLGSAGFYVNIEPVGRRPTYAYKFNATTLRVLYSDGHYEDLAV